MKQTVSAAIAVLLLGMYTYAVWTACRAPETAPSAATSPGRTLAAAPAGSRAGKIADVVTNLYLLAWLICGIALVITWMRVPAVSASVAAAAKSWLGLAIAAAYAFLGLKR